MNLIDHMCICEPGQWKTTNPYKKGCPIHDPKQIEKVIDEFFHNQPLQFYTKPEEGPTFEEVMNSLGYIIPKEPEFFYCEHFAMGDWKGMKTRDLAWVATEAREGRLRVPKLNEEHLFLLGWKKMVFCGVDSYIKDSHQLFLSDGSIYVEKIGTGKTQVYRGACKTINDFIAITKLMGI